MAFCITRIEILGYLESLSDGGDGDEISCRPPLGLKRRVKVMEIGVSPMGSTVVRYGCLTLIWVSDADFSVRRHLTIEHAKMTFHHLLRR